MKTNLFAVCLTLIFSFSVIAQEETPQTSPSDETIVVPSEVAPAYDAEPIAAEGMMIGNSIPIESIGCQMPVNCCCSGGIMQVAYQQQITSSPIPSTPITPAPIANQIGSSSVLQNPISTTQSGTITPIQQSSPFIQPRCCNGGQVIGQQISSPTTFSTPTTSPIITPINPTPIAGTVTPPTTIPSTTTFPTTTSFDGNFVEPSSTWYPETSYNYSNSNCCPQNRGFFSGGRIFGRRR